MNCSEVTNSHILNIQPFPTMSFREIIKVSQNIFGGPYLILNKVFGFPETAVNVATK